MLIWPLLILSTLLNMMSIYTYITTNSHCPATQLTTKYDHRKINHVCIKATIRSYRDLLTPACKAISPSPCPTNPNRKCQFPPLQSSFTNLGVLSTSARDRKSPGHAGISEYPGKHAQSAIADPRGVGTSGLRWGTAAPDDKYTPHSS